MILDLSGLLLFIIFTSPLISGCFFIFLRSIHHNKVFLIEFGLLIAGSIGLGFFDEKTISTSLSFMGESITFTISNTAISLFLMNVVILLAIFTRVVIANKNQISRVHALLLNLSLAFGFLAFMSGQFMIRYIALEIVGLLVALIVVKAFSNRESFKDLTVIFQVLRLGDLSLLASILMIRHYSGTLDISIMINTATTLPFDVRVWVFFGFIFAVLIKLAIWPFDVWLRRARKSAPESSFWISGFLMPSLGYYLHYRIIPIIASNTVFKFITFIIGLCLFFFSLFISRYRSQFFDRFIRLGSATNSLMFMAAAFISSEFIGFYLLGLILYRFILLIQEDVKSPIVNGFFHFFPIIINGLIIGLNLSNVPLWFTIIWLVLTGVMAFWDWREISNRPKNNDLIATGKPLSDVEPVLGQKLSVFAQWLNRKLEGKIFSLGILKFGNYFIEFANWLHKNVEMKIFTQGFQKLSDWFSKVSIWIRKNIEESFEKFWLGLSRSFVKISGEAFRKFEVISAEKSSELLNGALNSLRDHERIVLMKKLRWDLVLIPLFLIVILVFLAIF